MKIAKLGELPPVGEVPDKMHAIVIRQDRYGDPINAMQIEEISVPEIGDDEVLVAVKAAGVNYNNVWACAGYPLDLIGLRQKKGSALDFHIGGSEASGIVYKTGKSVTNVKIGDEVVIQGGIWDPVEPYVVNGGDPVISSSFLSWGYESNWGSFAQFCVVKELQCLPKPGHLSWEEAAVYMLTGATIYRMINRWQPNVVKKGTVALVWGGAGGLGVMALQMIREAGGIPVAVVNSDEKKKICMDLGAVGVINRNNYKHWGGMTEGDIHSEEYIEWRKEVVAFNKEILSFTSGVSPSLVIEHPGESTIPTSLFICSKGGMVVTCGGTSGYVGSFDLRYLWVHQKRIQGSHFASYDECYAVNEMIENKRIRPVLSKVYNFDEIPLAHQLMKENRHPFGNMAIRIGY